MRRLLLATAIVLATPFAAQAAGSPSESPLAKAAAALPFRSIGPSLMSGRILTNQGSHITTTAGETISGSKPPTGLQVRAVVRRAPLSDH